MNKNIIMIVTIVMLLSNISIILPSEKVNAGSYNGQDLALAILSNDSWLIDSFYEDKDQSGHRQAIVLSSLGTMQPTDGSNFALFSTGIAGASIVTTDQENPGDERGEWFEGDQKGHPRDEATLTMTLQVPPFMHYLYYDVQFFSAEYPEYVGTEFNDKFTVTVNSPAEGISSYFFDVNSGYFVLDSDGITGTGFDVYARSGNPDGIDILDRNRRHPGEDAGASDLIPIGGETHPVSPNEQITVTINIKDSGDNLVDSAAFIDNLQFSGYAKTEIVARKRATDLNGEPLECGDTIKYTVTISNTGDADQNNNPGNEFEDFIPDNTTYVAGSATATSGLIDYDPGENKIIWNGEIPAETAHVLEFQVTVNDSLENGTLISNQGTVYWDSNEDGNNDATELTDDAFVDDGIDLDGDGDTDDDDPVNLYVFVFDFPSSVSEDFSDDTIGGNATESYYGRKWFETSNSVTSCVFEVVSGYYYSTDNSYKTKIRATGSPQYWNYSLSELESDLDWWDIWFTCGDASEEYDLYLDFKNSIGEDIARIKFEYVQEGDNPPTDWVLELYYWDPVLNWVQLYSDYAGGYLRNSWYKLRIEKNGENFIDYSLNRSGVGAIDFSTGNKLDASFSDFTRMQWSSTKNPVVCPMFFWDDHTVGLI